MMCRSLTSHAVIERLCRLTSVVRCEGFENLPSDCFCNKSKMFVGNDNRTFDDGYRFDSEIIEFIELAVKEKLKNAKNL